MKQAFSYGSAERGVGSRRELAEILQSVLGGRGVGSHDEAIVLDRVPPKTVGVAVLQLLQELEVYH